MINRLCINAKSVFIMAACPKRCPLFMKPLFRKITEIQALAHDKKAYFLYALPFFTKICFTLTFMLLINHIDTRWYFVVKYNMYL